MRGEAGSQAPGENYSFFLSQWGSQVWGPQVGQVVPRASILQPQSWQARGLCACRWVTWLAMHTGTLMSVSWEVIGLLVHSPLGGLSVQVCQLVTHGPAVAQKVSRKLP